VSPDPTVADEDNGPAHNKFPAVNASKMPMLVTVPHDADAAGNVIAAFDAINSDAAAAMLPPTATRAYEPPDTSTPPVPAGIVGAVVNRPRYVVGFAYVPSPNPRSKRLFDRYVLMFAIRHHLFLGTERALPAHDETTAGGMTSTPPAPSE
jgi:hypothetical protein